MLPTNSNIEFIMRRCLKDLIDIQLTNNEALGSKMAWLFFVLFNFVTQ